MFSLAQLESFLGLCALINYGVLVFSMMMILGFEGPISKIHSNLFGLPKEKVRKSYFNYLAYYKLLVIVFFLVPYLVLRLWF